MASRYALSNWAHTACVTDALSSKPAQCTTSPVVFVRRCFPYPRLVCPVVRFGRFLANSRHGDAGLKAVYPEASYADLWTLAGATAISYMGGPTIKWSPGRVDADAPTTVPDGEG